MRRAMLVVALAALILVSAAAAMTKTTSMYCPAGLNGHVLIETSPGTYSAVALLYYPPRWYSAPAYRNSKLNSLTCPPNTTCSFVFYTALVPAHALVQSINVTGPAFTVITKWCSP